MMDEATDTALVAAFKNERTKENAFATIIKKYQQKLYWHIRRMVITHQDADDVLQNTCIKIWNGLQNFRADSKLYTWLYRIATNESLTFLAIQKQRRNISIDNTDYEMSNTLQAETNFDAQKIEWKLQMAILQLPEKQKAVFNLRYFDEMPYGEMSVVLQTSEGALKASYHHAVKKIELFILNH
jgi:RNA polymerase sigma factor (sigma-70 family)